MPNGRRYPSLVSTLFHRLASNAIPVGIQCPMPNSKDRHRSAIELHQRLRGDILAQWLIQAVSLLDPALLSTRLAIFGQIGSGDGAAAAAKAFWRACETRQPEMSAVLLRAGFPPNHRRPDAENDTPVIWACYHGDAATLRLLLAAGADPMVSNDAHETPLAHAAKYGHADCLRELFQAGVPLNHGSIFQQTPPMLAISCGQALCLSAMIDAGLPIDAPLADIHGAPGNTPLGSCAFYRQHDCARVLLLAGADPGLSAPSGSFPLMWAAANGDLRMSQLLVEAGANPRQRTPDSASYAPVLNIVPPSTDCEHLARDQLYIFTQLGGTPQSTDTADYLLSAISKLDLQEATPAPLILGPQLAPFRI